MKKHFIAALTAIEEHLAAAASTSDWSKSDVVESNNEDGRIIYIKESALHDILTEPQIEVLVASEVMLHDGISIEHKAGRRTMDAFAIDLDMLQEVAKHKTKSESEVVKFRKKVNELQREVRLLQHDVQDNQALNALMDVLTETYKNPLAGKKKQKAGANPFKVRQTAKSKRVVGGVPTLMLSDVHYGESVDPAQIQYTNEYNEVIADTRLDRVFSEFLNITHNTLTFDYDGAVVILGGDMTSGSIHEELSMTNWCTDNEAVLKLAEKLSQGILAIAEAFPFVYIPCVVGNHGRERKKPYAKLKVKMNKDYLLYKIVEKIVTLQAPNVEFDILESADVRYNVYGTRYLLTHGDQFSGGSGDSGLFASLNRTDHRKRRRGLKTGDGLYDYLVMGHFHQYGTLEGIIVNGSLKGMDEYAWNGNFGWEPAIQAMWLTHPAYGITMHMPIYGDEISEDDGSELQPITRESHEKARRFGSR